MCGRLELAEGRDEILEIVLGGDERADHLDVRERSRIELPGRGVFLAGAGAAAHEGEGAERLGRGLQDPVESGVCLERGRGSGKFEAEVGDLCGRRQELEGQVGVDGEVAAAAAAGGPEEIAVPRSVDRDQLARGEHGARRAQVVRGQARPARIVADPAAERQAGDADLRAGADRQHPLAAAQLLQQLAIDRTGIDPDDAAHLVDVNPPHQSGDDEEPVGRRHAYVVVAAAADRERHAFLPRPGKRCRDVLGRLAEDGGQRQDAVIARVGGDRPGKVVARPSAQSTRPVSFRRSPSMTLDRLLAAAAARMSGSSRAADLRHPRAGDLRKPRRLTFQARDDPDCAKCRPPSARRLNRSSANSDTARDSSAASEPGMARSKISLSDL